MPVELREVLNYVVAAEEGFAWVRERPVTGVLISRLQATLVANTPSEHRDAGRLRDVQVAVGARGEAIERSRFVPPPPGDQLRAGFEDWIGWLRDPPAEISPVARAAMSHYQFETLHPYSDGNGRIGRLAIALELMQDRVLREPILVVSPWFEARREAYQDGLLALSTTGDWDEWVHFFAKGIAESADATRSRVEALLGWRDETLKRVREAGVSGVAERVAGELIGAPILRGPTVARRHGVTPQGAMFALRRLVELELLVELRVRGRVSFEAPRVLALLRGAS